MERSAHVTILVNGHPHHLEQTVLAASEIRSLVAAPSDYEVWKVIKAPDPEGQLPVDDQQVTGSIEVKSGDRFRVVPPGTFGSMQVLTDAIREAARVLEGMGYPITLQEEEGLGVLVIGDYPLGPGWNKSSTRVLLKLPTSFPAGKPDMFWTDQDLLLANGTVPKQAGHIETILGEPWRRFSWHPASWTPGVDDIRTFFEFVARRLADPQ